MQTTFYSLSLISQHPFWISVGGGGLWKTDCEGCSPKAQGLLSPLFIQNSNLSKSVPSWLSNLTFETLLSRLTHRAPELSLPLSITRSSAQAGTRSRLLLEWSPKGLASHPQQNCSLLIQQLAPPSEHHNHPSPCPRRGSEPHLPASRGKEIRLFSGHLGHICKPTGKKKSSFFKDDSSSTRSKIFSEPLNHPSLCQVLWGTGLSSRSL